MSAMSDRLLSTLDAIDARDAVASEVLEKSTPLAPRPGVDFNEETGEWLGEPPEGYRPLAEAPSLDEIVTKDSKVPDFDKTDVTVDYKRVRDTTYALQEATLFMVGQAAKLAVSTEAPRAFSVFKELVETVRGLNKDLMENQKTFKTVTQGQEPPPGDDTTVDVTISPDGTSTVSVGKKARSSRDLLKLVEEAKKKADEKTAQRAADRENEDITDVEPIEIKEPAPTEGVENGVSEA